MRGVPILMYHDVTPRPHPTFAKYAVTPRAFAAQMRWLAMTGHTAVTLDALLAHRAGGARLPRRPVVITFDDAFASCVDLVPPILAAHGFTATFYLVAGLMGGRSEWLRRARGVTFPIATWAAARALRAAGFECGAHTLTHPHLTEVPAATRREELARSRAMIEDALGAEARHFAYPFGAYDDRVREEVARAGYRSACSVRIGLSSESDDALALHRVPVSGGESLLAFACRVRTARAPRDVVRGKVRRARARIMRLMDGART